jgi:hypothetical protein
MNSPAMILTAVARFLLQDEQVEAGDSDGGHYKARGGLCRRRRPESVGLGFRHGEKLSREGRNSVQCSSLGFIRRWRAPCHDAERGGRASAREKTSTSSCCRPCA